MAAAVGRTTTWCVEMWYGTVLYDDVGESWWKFLFDFDFDFDFNRNQKINEKNYFDKGAQSTGKGNFVFFNFKDDGSSCVILFSPTDWLVPFQSLRSIGIQTIPELKIETIKTFSKWKNNSA
jgi:hypothetical protein